MPGKPAQCDSFEIVVFHGIRERLFTDSALLAEEQETEKLKTFVKQPVILQTCEVRRLPRRKTVMESVAQGGKSSTLVFEAPP